MEEVYVNVAVDDKSDVAELMKVFTEDNTYNDVNFLLRQRLNVDLRLLRKVWARCVKLLKGIEPKEEWKVKKELMPWIKYW